MRRILDYKIKSKKNIQLSFVSSRLFVAVPYGKNLFEPKLFGSFGTKFQKFSGHGDLVKLEDPEFEKSFVVYSSDQTEARYILSTSLMKRILDYKIKSKKNIQLSFVSSRLFVAVPYGKDLFEPKLFGEITDFESVEEYYNDLKLVLELIEDLNLNTRIWTKE